MIVIRYAVFLGYCFLVRELIGSSAFSGFFDIWDCWSEWLRDASAGASILVGGQLHIQWLSWGYDRSQPCLSERASRRSFQSSFFSSSFEKRLDIAPTYQKSVWSSWKVASSGLQILFKTCYTFAWRSVYSFVWDKPIGPSLALQTLPTSFACLLVSWPFSDRCGADPGLCQFQSLG